MQVGPAALSVLAVFLLGTTRGSSTYTPDFTWADKVGHLVAFAFVAYTHVRAMDFLLGGATRDKVLLTAGGVSVGWGGLLELVQATLPHRTAEWGDFVADTLGVLCALLLLRRGGV